jgi:deoxyribodipyrimidine photo-lyase
MYNNRIIGNAKESFDRVIYLMTNTFRLQDNLAIEFGLELALKCNNNFQIIILDELVASYNLPQQKLLSENIAFMKNNAPFLVKQISIPSLLEQNSKTQYICDLAILKTHKSIASKFKNIIQIDSNHFVPLQVVSNKQEYAARTIRPKIWRNFSNNFIKNPSKYPIYPPCQQLMDEFVETKLANYTHSSNPNTTYSSGLSHYINLGILPIFKFYLSIISAPVDLVQKEAFTEQLVVRRELASNFCFYNEQYDQLGSWVPSFINVRQNQNAWYTFDQLVNAKTNDQYWNLAQTELIKTGRIHNYMRMYWGKKIIEWTATFQEAHSIMVELNDKYAIDGNSPNGYVGINWCFGLHDRAFVNRDWFGKLRYMNEGGIKRKFKNLDKYAARIARKNNH